MHHNCIKRIENGFRLSLSHPLVLLSLSLSHFIFIEYDGGRQSEGVESSDDDMTMTILRLKHSKILPSTWKDYSRYFFSSSVQLNSSPRWRLEIIANQPDAVLCGERRVEAWIEFEFPLRKFEKRRRGMKRREIFELREKRKITNERVDPADGWEMKMLGHNFLLIFYRFLLFE